MDNHNMSTLCIFSISSQEGSNTNDYYLNGHSSHHKTQHSPKKIHFTQYTPCFKLQVNQAKKKLTI